MIERVVEYLANALWQLPLLAAGAWWLLRAARLGPLAQHRVWVAVLGLGVVLPLARVAPQTVVVGPVVTGSAERLSGAGAMVDVPLQERNGGAELSWVREVFRRRDVEVSAGVARGLVVLYLELVLLGLLRIARGWSAARRVVAGADDVCVSESLGSLLEECGERLGVSIPRVVESAEVMSPAVVGPVLVLPEGFARYSEDERRAALLHELAHLRRRDYGANLLCEMAGLPVVWHPLSYAVRSRIRSTREMVCDGMAAGAMGSVTVYARSLVGLAARACAGGLEAQPMAVGLFTNNNLEERVMRLMETKATVTMRARMTRLMGAIAGMVAVVALAGMVHVTPAMAQTTVPTAPQSTALPTGPTAPSAVPTVAPTVEPPAPPMLPVAAASPASAESSASGQSSSAGDALAASATSQESSAGMGQSSGTGASSSGVGSSRSAGGLQDESTLAGSHGVGLTGATVVNDVDKDCPIGHGTNSHHWLTSERKDFWIINCDAKEPTEEQKKSMEKKFHEQMGDLQKQTAELHTELSKLNGPLMMRQMEDAQKQLAGATLQLNSPVFQKRMDERMAVLKRELEVSKVDRLEAQKQLSTLNTMEMRQRMAELQKQFSEDGLNGLHAQLELKQLDSAEMKRQMAEMDRQISKLTSKEVQKQIEEQMLNARKQMEDAQKMLEREQQRMKEHPETPCIGDCVPAPQ